MSDQTTSAPFDQPQSPAYSQAELDEAIAKAVAERDAEHAATAVPAEPEKEPVKLPDVGELVEHKVNTPWGPETRLCRVVKTDEEGDGRVWLERLEVIGPLGAGDVAGDPDF